MPRPFEVALLLIICALAPLTMAAGSASAANVPCSASCGNEGTNFPHDDDDESGSDSDEGWRRGHGRDGRGDGHRDLPEGDGGILEEILEDLFPQMPAPLPAPLEITPVVETAPVQPPAEEPAAAAPPVEAPAVVEPAPPAPEKALAAPPAAAPTAALPAIAEAPAPVVAIEAPPIAEGGVAVPPPPASYVSAEPPSPAHRFAPTNVDVFASPVPQPGPFSPAYIGSWLIAIAAGTLLVVVAKSASGRDAERLAAQASPSLAPSTTIVRDKPAVLHTRRRPTRVASTRRGRRHSGAIRRGGPLAGQMPEPQRARQLVRPRSPSPF